MASSVFSLTSAIGRIAPGRAEQRDVIMPLRLGNGKAQRHDVQEGRRPAFDSPAAIMVPDRKAQFVAPDRQRPVADQRPVRATVGVRYRCSYPVIALTRQFV